MRDPALSDMLRRVRRVFGVVDAEGTRGDRGYQVTLLFAGGAQREVHSPTLLSLERALADALGILHLPH